MVNSVVPDVIVVVVSYNQQALTQRCVESLRQQTIVDRLKIIVWDNASTDGTVSWLRDQSTYLGITAELSSTNLLWTPALNAALRKYSADEAYIVVMNNDLTLQPNALEKLIQVLAENPDAGLAGPVGYGIGGRQGEREPGPPIQVPWVCGALMALPRKVYGQVGVFAEDMPLGGDEHDYAIRLLTAGYSIWMVRDSRVEHNSHATRNEPEWNLHSANSLKAFNNKYSGFFTDRQAADFWGGNWSPELANLMGRRPEKGSPVVRLNVGCGAVQIPGVIGVDVHRTPATQLQAQATKLPFASSSVESLDAHQIIEHLFPGDSAALLAEWSRVLRVGGILYVTTPDFGYVARSYVAGQMGIELARAYVCGTVDGLNTYDRKVPESYHRTLWDEHSLRFELSRTGFANIQIWNEEWNLHCKARRT